MRIILDAMGSDNGPEVMVEGAVMACEELGCDITLTGDEDVLKPSLAGRCSDKIEVVDAKGTIIMEDSALSSVRGKKDSSMSVALSLLAEGKGDAAVSAGNTGAFFSGAMLTVKRIKGIKRAALAPMLPTKTGHVLLIDCGANSECKPEFLEQFAILGHYYMKNVMGKSDPKIALVNNGVEETKGTPLQREAHVLLKTLHEKGKINFIGNIEGRDILSGDADVLVCDGFTGNILLKTVEGVGAFLVSEMKDMFMKNTGTKIAASIVKPGLKKIKTMMDYKEVGGAPMLGISKPVIKAHGSSDARAVKSAIRQAVSFASSGYVQAVEDELAENTNKEKDE